MRRTQPDLFPESPFQQPFDLFKCVLAMSLDASAEWLDFLEKVKSMRQAQQTAQYGVPHSQKKRAAAEKPVDDLLAEWADVQRMGKVELNFKEADQ